MTLHYSKGFRMIGAELLSLFVTGVVIWIIIKFLKPTNKLLNLSSKVLDTEVSLMDDAYDKHIEKNGSLLLDLLDDDESSKAKGSKGV